MKKESRTLWLRTLMRRHRMKLVCVAVLVANLGAGIIIFFLGTYGEIGKCTSTYPSIKFKSETAKMYFSADYFEAREKFLEVVRDSGATTVENIKLSSAKGPNDEELFTDVVLFGPRDAKTFLVIVSGTHGVEGFAGSAIQVGLINEKVVSSPPDGIGILLIHALNPYGMANGRRFNEDNVDLNRNFRDHRATPPGNPHYEELASAIAPKSVSFRSEVVSWFSLLAYRARHGDEAIQAAITQGQNSHHDGLFYGGTSDAWSNTTLRSVADRYLANSKRVVVVDVHTGLGAFGDYEIILNDPVASRVFRRATDIWGEPVKSTLPSGSVSDRSGSASAHVTGTLKRGVSANLRGQVTAVSLEFGTLPPKQVFKALRAEGWLHHHGGMNHPKAQSIKKCLLHAFYPNSNDWKASVWKQGRDVIEKALIWLEDDPDK